MTRQQQPSLSDEQVASDTTTQIFNRRKVTPKSFAAKKYKYTNSLVFL
jgi:hypothetical protein